MRVTKANIEKAIEQQIEKVIEWMESHESEVNGSIPCVIVQQATPRKYDVGWRFTKIGARVGDVHRDFHVSAYPDQKIVWIAKK